MSSSEFVADGAYTFRQLQSPLTAQSGRDLLAAAIAEADQIREAARAEGAAAGRAQAAAEVHAQASAQLAQLADAHSALQALRDQVISELAADSALLGLQLAEQIVAGAVDVAPERIIDVAGQALRRLSERRSVTLVVNPSELDVLSEAVGALRAQLGGIEHLSVQADRRVARGGVRARTDEGEIDATVDTQLRRAREIVAEALSGAGEMPDAIELSEMVAVPDGDVATLPDADVVPDAVALPDADALPDAVVLPDADALPDAVVLAESDA